MAILALAFILAFLYFSLKWLARRIGAKGLSPHPPRPTPPRIPAGQHKRRPPLPPPLAPLAGPKREEGDAPEKNTTFRQGNVPTHPYLPDYQIHYTDRNGLNTDRRITIIKVYGNMLYAYCHLRHAKRSFYISSTSRWTNCSTGEIIEDILQDFQAERKKSAFGSLDRMTEDLFPVMGILLYLGKGNKRLMIDERNVIIQTYRTLCPDPRLTDRMINDGINEITPPSKTKYKQLVTELSGMDLEIQTLVAGAAMRLFASRKALNSIEKEGLKELSQKLKINL